MLFPFQLGQWHNLLVFVHNGEGTLRINDGDDIKASYTGLSPHDIDFDSMMMVGAYPDGSNGNQYVLR